jgi:ABC-type transporter Mla MlaB component
MTSHVDARVPKGPRAHAASPSDRRDGVTPARARATTPPAIPAPSLTLEGALTIRTIEAAHARLIEAMRGAAPLEIDCGGASEVDVSFIQLLLAAKASARKRGQGIALAAPASGALLDALTRGGFIAAGGLPSEEDAFWLKGANAQ